LFCFAKTKPPKRRCGIRNGISYTRGKIMENFTLTKTKGYWHYYCYDKGKRRRFSTGLKNQKRAYQYCIDLERNGRLIPGKETDLITFEDFAKPFFVWGSCPIVTDKIARGYHYSQTLCISNKLSLNKNIMPTFGNLRLTEISEDMVNSWLLNLKNPRIINGKEYRGLANSTANKQLKLLRDILQIAVNRRILQYNPAKSIHKLYDNAKIRGTFSIDEAKQILGHKEYWKSHYAYLASYLSAVTGMRSGEIRALTRENIKGDHIVVEFSFDRTVGKKCTKSDKKRELPIPPEILRELLYWAPDDDGYIFSLTGGKTPLSAWHLLDGLKKAALAAGISKEKFEKRNLCFHSWRHFFNTRLIASGVQGEITRAIVGHESEDMTERYLHLTASDMEVVARVQDELVKVVG